MREYRITAIHLALLGASALKVGLSELEADIGETSKSKLQRETLNELVGELTYLASNWTNLDLVASRHLVLENLMRQADAACWDGFSVMELIHGPAKA